MVASTLSEEIVFIFIFSFYASALGVVVYGQILMTLGIIDW